MTDVLTKEQCVARLTAMIEMILGFSEGVEFT